MPDGSLSRASLDVVAGILLAAFLVSCSSCKKSAEQSGAEKASTKKAERSTDSSDESEFTSSEDEPPRLIELKSGLPDDPAFGVPRLAYNWVEYLLDPVYNECIWRAEDFWIAQNGDLLVVGKDGTVGRRRSGKWTCSVIRGTGSLMSVQATSLDDFWATGTMGMLHVKGKEIELISWDWGGPYTDPHAIWVSDGGSVHLASDPLGVHTLEDGDLVELSDISCDSIAGREAGDLYVSSREHRTLHHIEKGESTEIELPAKGKVGSVAIGQNDELLLTTENGLFQLTAGQKWKKATTSKVGAWKFYRSSKGSPYLVTKQGLLVQNQGKWVEVPFDRLADAPDKDETFLFWKDGVRYEATGGVMKPLTQWPRRPRLQDIWGSSSDDIWAVGDAGCIMHFDGKSWSLVESPTDKDLDEVHVLKQGCMYALGKSVVLKGVDGVWQDITPESLPERLLGLWGLTCEEVLTVGAYGISYILRDGKWQRLATGTTSSLWELWGRSPKEVYAAGSYGIILRWDGSSWQQELTESHLWLGAITGTSEGPILAGGGGRYNQVGLVREDGKWIRSPILGRSDLFALDEQRVFSITYNSEYGDEWGEGSYYQGKERYPVGIRPLPYHTVSVESLDDPEPGEDTVLDLWGDSMDSMWGVDGGLYKLVVDERGRKEPKPVPKDPLAGDETAPLLGPPIEKCGPDHDTAIEQLGWHLEESGTEHTLHAVWGPIWHNIFAAGDSGTLLRFRDNRWRKIKTATTSSILDLWGTSSYDVWAVGSDGVILHCEGPSCEKVDSGTQSHLTAIVGFPTGEIVVAGHEGTLLQWDGQVWKPMNRAHSRNVIT